MSEKKTNRYLFYFTNLSNDKFAVSLGLLLIFLFAITVVYFGSERIKEIDRFYPVNFKVNFLSGIEPGMKVRYQGGVVIGEVTEVVSQYSSHSLRAKIDKDFFIPKYNTKITIKKFGYFGKLYIDITSVSQPFETDLYKPNDMIEIEPVQPFEKTLQMFSDLIKNSDDGNIAPLSIKLLYVRNMMNRFRNSPLSNPKLVRQKIGNFSHKVQSDLKSLQLFSSSAYNTVNDMYNTLTVLSDNLRQNIPVISARIEGLKSYTYYKDMNGESSMLHDELLYWTVLNNIDTFHQKLLIYKDEPYKIFF